MFSFKCTTPSGIYVCHYQVCKKVGAEVSPISNLAVSFQKADRFLIIFVSNIQIKIQKPKFFCTFPIFFFDVFLGFLSKYIYQMVFMLSLYKRKMKNPNFSAKKN